MESEEGKGSTFFLSIPIGNQENMEKINENPPMSIKMKSDVHLKALIVEDDEVSDLYLQKIMKPFADSIVSTWSGKEAIKILQEHHDIDVVLMDMKMHHMDGYQTTAEIRKFNQDIIIIAQTAYALFGDKEKALASGCNDYISKPIDRGELNKIIEKWFSKTKDSSS